MRITAFSGPACACNVAHFSLASLPPRTKKEWDTRDAASTTVLYSKTVRCYRFYPKLRNDRSGWIGTYQTATGRSVIEASSNYGPSARGSRIFRVCGVRYRQYYRGTAPHVLPGNTEIFEKKNVLMHVVTCPTLAR